MGSPPSKEKLPDGYAPLAPGEELQVLTPDDKFPRHYHIGPDAPDLVKYPEDDSGEPSYWFDLTTNSVKVSMMMANKMTWGASKMTKLVADLSSEPMTIFAKIVQTKPEPLSGKSMNEAAEESTSFKEALEIAKSRGKKNLLVNMTLTEVEAAGPDTEGEADKK